MVMFFDASLWLTVTGAILLLVSGLATVGCLITVLGLNGKKKRYPAKVSSIKSINGGVEVEVKVLEPQFTYQPGQFAFIGFDDKERPHPFSLASAHNENGQVRLLIKPMVITRFH